MLKDAFEDYARYQRDKEENEKKCQKYDKSAGDFKEAQWSEV